MGLVTIGEFARLSGLTPKALRLYDELGLLPPARVDPASGYRLYDPAQLAQARLVAWLRRLGLPLARIRVVCGLPPAAAAAEVASYWAASEADHATRRQLAALLIRELSGEEPAMTTATMEIRYAAGTDIGLARARNQDAAFAGPGLLAVADGFGDGGELASAAAIGALSRLAGGPPAGDLLGVLREAVQRANDALPGLAGAAQAGTTLTAVLWSGSRLALAHIGDSRACLLRGGELFQITHDHSYVQRLVDEGKLLPEEAASHPQQMLLARALDGSPAATADLSVHDVRAGDRYLLCSDGLSRAVPAPAIRAALAGAPGPAEAVAQLIGLANQAGGPDNIACAVAEVHPVPALAG